MVLTKTSKTIKKAAFGNKRGLFLWALMFFAASAQGHMAPMAQTSPNLAKMRLSFTKVVKITSQTPELHDFATFMSE
ncbi:MAG: hypothetical protein ACJA2X_002750 [Halocynthiibacter sp.]